MWRKTAYFLALAAILTLPAHSKAQNNSLTKKEKRHGWQLLFNGQNLDGWHLYLKPEGKPRWRVEDGAIRTDLKNGGVAQDLVTDEEFENYELQLQWKIAEGGNSGIIFNIHEDPQYPATYFTGPEMQVLDNVKASDNKKANHLAGSLYDLVAAEPKYVLPAGQWNTIRIRMKEGHLRFFMNGHKVVETILWTDAWKRSVANSKFKQWPAFGTFQKGHLALQYHGGEVWYRNVKIRKL